MRAGVKKVSVCGTTPSQTRDGLRRTLTWPRPHEILAHFFRPFPGEKELHMFPRIATLGVGTAAVCAAALASLGAQASRPPAAPSPQTQAAKKHVALVGGMLIDGYEV